MNPGDPFPDFALADQSGNLVTAADLRGKPCVVYFYPKDDTSGCTVEACEFRDAFALRQGDAGLVGVSPDSVASHRKFAEKYGLAATLLADVEHRLCLAAGVWVEKSMYGRTYMGVARTTFLLDAAGVVLQTWRGVKPRGHAAAVVAALK